MYPSGLSCGDSPGADLDWLLKEFGQSETPKKGVKK